MTAPAPDPRLTSAWRNWGRNQACEPVSIDDPRDVGEVRDVVRRARQLGHRVKVAASGHSFTDIACTDGRLLRLDALDGVLEIDHETRVVRVGAGIPLWRLNAELDGLGLALPNLGDIDRQTLAGAISTGTHGTGVRWQGIASAVVGMELVTADGEIVRCSSTEEPELLACARVGLGALGVVTAVSLQCVPTFHLRAEEGPVPWDRFHAEWDSVVDAHDHVDCYWFPHTDICTVKASDRTDAPVHAKPAWKQQRDDVFWANHYHGALAAVGRRKPRMVPELMRRVATGIGTSSRVDVSHKVFCSPRFVRFVEMEYAVPRDAMSEGLRRVRGLIETEELQVDFPVEIRALGGDDIPLSMAHGRESCFLAVHVSAGTPHERYFRGVEAIMDALGGRPHWGKLHFQDASTLAGRYPEWERFGAVRARLDPDARFGNAYTDRVLGLP